MGGYIRLDKGQVEDPRLFTAAHELSKVWDSFPPRLGVMRHALLGVTVTLWAYADTHIHSDDALRVTLEGLALILDVPVQLLELLPAAWLRVRGDGFVELPGYCAKNRIRAKDLRKLDTDARTLHKREVDAARAQRYRDRKRHGKGNGVTHKGVTLPSRVTQDTGTGTGPIDHTGTVPTRAATRRVADGPAPPREETPEVKAARSKLRTLVAGLGSEKAIKR